MSGSVLYHAGVQLKASILLGFVYKVGCKLLR